MKEFHDWFPIFTKIFTMDGVKLYMLQLGCKPEGRHTEQHDIFFGIGTSLTDLVPAIIEFWPEANGKIHIDAWREVNVVDGYSIAVRMRAGLSNSEEQQKLFFLNLGGYKEGDFEEYHYKCLSVAASAPEAISQAKAQAFWKHSVSSHIDDKYGIDVDDIYEIEEVLAPRLKEKYEITVEQSGADSLADVLHPGYLKLSKLIDR
jgi:hypothetical protein